MTSVAEVAILLFLLCLNTEEIEVGLEKVQNLRLGAVREERGNENVFKITDSLKLVPNMYDSLTNSIAIMNTPLGENKGTCWLRFCQGNLLSV